VSTGPSFDVLVIGSGIAGLSFALKAARLGRSVAILTKKNQAESNTNYAQGGIAVVTAKTDDVDKHVQDTLVAGDGLCDEKVVREIVRDGPARVQELVELGLEFSRDANGGYDLGREGGHTERRVLHVKDMTGKAIESALIKALSLEPRIAMYEHMFAIDIITRRKLAPKTPKRDDRVLGVYALDVRDGHVLTFEAPVVMLSTGGAGQAYLYTTNPDIATGDGIAMAYRAGIEVRNMEFIQFHPTALYSTSGLRFLITEAVRGEGAILRNAAGEAFMKDYHPMADLAPRDIVARAIDTEMKKSGVAHVWLDITHRNEAFLRTRFPLIYKTCKDIGINIAKAMIPVVPAAHYTCGGVLVDQAGHSDIPGLYAIGETSFTGLHGANRMASNSLLECFVYARSAAADICQQLDQVTAPVALPSWDASQVTDSDEDVIIAHNWDELRRFMWDYVGIVRTNKRLQRAEHRVRLLLDEIDEFYSNYKVSRDLIELRNLAQVAELIIRSAMQRRESRGLHYTLDYPEQLSEARDTILLPPTYAD
jgi:L-aspartate oxidase